MDGFNPNAFLAKKLLNEGLLDEEIQDKPKETKSVLKTAKEPETVKSVLKTVKELETEIKDSAKHIKEKELTENSPVKEISIPQKKRLSNSSVESNTQVIINPNTKTVKGTLVITAEEEHMETEILKSIDTTTEMRKPEKEKETTALEKRKSLESTTTTDLKPDTPDKRKSVETKDFLESPSIKRMRASPIVFDVKKKEKRERERTESASSDVVTVTTSVNASKYDTVPSCKLLFSLFCTC